MIFEWGCIEWTPTILYLNRIAFFVPPKEQFLITEWMYGRNWIDAHK